MILQKFKSLTHVSTSNTTEPDSQSQLDVSDMVYCSDTNIQTQNELIHESKVKSLISLQTRTQDYKKKFNLQLQIENKFQIFQMQKTSSQNNSASANSLIDTIDTTFNLEDLKYDQMVQQIDYINKEICQKYKILEKIGEGNQGQVFKIVDRKTNEIFVAKLMKYSEEEIRKLIYQEYVVLKSLHNENIIKAIEIYEGTQDNGIVIIYEYFESRSLFALINEVKHAFKIQEIANILKTLLESITFLHSQSIVHRDINLNNVLFSPKLQKIKIIDFGVSTQIHNIHNDMLSSNGNKLFQAPEISKCFYNEKIDEYGVGLIILSLLEKSVITSKKVKGILNKNNEKNSTQTLLYKIVQNLLHKDFQQRYSAVEALKQLQDIQISDDEQNSL